MKKKVIAILMATAMVAAMAGCGNNDTPASSSDNSSSTQSSEASKEDNSGTTEVTDVTLKVWVPNNQVDTGIIDEQETAFAAAHPEWNIKWVTEIVGDDTAKTELLKDVDAGADVFMFASDQLLEMVDAGAIAQLGGEAEKMVQETIDESVRATAMAGDETYAIPYTHNTFFMYYDKSIMSDDDITSLETLRRGLRGDTVGKI